MSRTDTLLAHSPFSHSFFFLVFFFFFFSLLHIHSPLLPSFSLSLPPLHNNSLSSLPPITMSAPAAPQYKVDVQKAVGFQPAPQKVVYTSRDLMLYALSIGVKQDELKFLYENDAQFAAFPTYPLVLGLKKDTHGVSVYGGGGKEDVPGIPAFDPNKLVHGDQSIEIFRPLPLGGEFELHTTVSGVYDKGKGMVIERTTKMVDPKEPPRPYSSMKGSAFVRGYGGWGGPKGPKQESYEPPKDKAPDAEYEDKTNDDLAILYRLSG